MIFVDTNVFIRYLLKDNRQQSLRASNLINRAIEGKVQLWTTEWVIAEIYWTLSLKKYQFPKASLFEALWTILNFKGLKVRNEEVVVESLLMAEKGNIELIDAFNAVLARNEGIETVYSFDRDFNRIPWLKRREP